MTDGGLKLELDEALSARLKAAADAAGRPVDAYAAELISDGLNEAGIEWSDDPDPEIDRRIADEAIRTGNFVHWTDVRPWVESWGKPDEAPAPKWPKSD